MARQPKQVHIIFIVKKRIIMVCNTIKEKICLLLVGNMRRTRG